jgi:hypothetical protein
MFLSFHYSSFIPRLEAATLSWLWIKRNPFCVPRSSNIFFETRCLASDSVAMLYLRLSFVTSDRVTIVTKLLRGIKVNPLVNPNLFSWYDHVLNV